MIFWGVCIRFFVTPVFFLLRIFYFDLRCEHLLVCHPNSSQNAWCGWLQLPDSIHFNTICSKPFPTGFSSETISLQISKPYFHVIRLFPWIMKVYTWLMVRAYIYIYIVMYIYIYIYPYIHTYIYILYICILLYIIAKVRWSNWNGDTPMCWPFNTAIPLDSLKRPLKSIIEDPMLGFGGVVYIGKAFPKPM